MRGSRRNESQVRPRRFRRIYPAVGQAAPGLRTQKKPRDGCPWAFSSFDFATQGWPKLRADARRVLGQKIARAAIGVVRIRHGRGRRAATAHACTVAGVGHRHQCVVGAVSSPASAAVGDRAAIRTATSMATGFARGAAARFATTTARFAATTARFAAINARLAAAGSAFIATRVATAQHFFQTAASRAAGHRNRGNYRQY